MRRFIHFCIPSGTTPLRAEPVSLQRTVDFRPWTVPNFIQRHAQNRGPEQFGCQICNSFSL